ncbi:RNA-binding protein 34 [Dryobates pubescens]|uniref:RNA-binding protein 34 n=1 Tax=Dryobates pubescens TaxID=118200 RepID=UPI0023B9C108|nr:RNA-binding protein 34 [Dryobates pubescens]
MGAKQRGLETRGARGPPPPGKRARGEAPPLSPRARGRGGGGAGGAEEYVVGQVAGSLWPDAAPDAPLARLFSCSAAGVAPALVPVTGENKKRKWTEVEKVAEDQSSSVIQEPPIKPKKVRKNELSKAEKELSNRESTLVQADEKEKEKLFQNKAKPRKSASHAITRRVVNSDKGTTAKQKKGEKVIDETVGRRTVFVGNLPVSCTRQALKSLFKEYGRIKSVRFRSLVPAEATLSKKLAAIKNKVHPNAKFINAYVVFEEECDAVEALKENGREIASGFHIRVDIASKSSLHDNKRSIFLGNLSYDISDDAVREHFSVCGGVVGVRIVRDRKTGLGKGFGYVLFENTETVHVALKLNKSNLMGRKMGVKRCGEKRKAPWKSADQSHPRNRANNTLKNRSCSDEKAIPLKKNRKQKVLKTIPRNRAVKKTGQSFDEKSYNCVYYCYKE